MARAALLLVAAVIAVLATPSSAAQVSDTLLTWRTYLHNVTAQVRVFRIADERRPLTAVVDELANRNAGPATDDARFLAETIGRMVGSDPAEMTFVFRFSAASFCEAGAGGKQLLVRATFTRTRTGALASPSWRIITREELASLTDRALY